MTVTIGDKSYTYNRFDPFATPIGFGADINMIYQRMGAIKDTDKYATMEKYLLTAISMTGSSNPELIRINVERTDN